MDEQTMTLSGRPLTIKTGVLARQAGGSVVVQYGETVVLATATMGKPLRPDANFMPLLVEYEEKFYAAGKIKGSRFMKREGRPADESILTMRLVDRSIRPLFPDDIINDIQVVLTVLSYDGENDPDVIGLIAASGALMVSDVPWNGPLGAVRMGMIGGEFVVNPTTEQREKSKLDLVVAGTADSVVMLEGGANELTEADMMLAIDKAKLEIKQVAAVISELAKRVGKTKQEPIMAAIDREKQQTIQDKARPVLTEHLIGKVTKEQIGGAERESFKLVWEGLSEDEKLLYTEHEVRGAIHELHGTIAREHVLKESKRTDGRRTDEIRPLSIMAGLLPRTHGSGLFQRGQTQILTVATLGGPTDQLIVDTMESETKKRYIHYYNFPGYSVGEIKPSRGPGRREIGHGALAERALLPVLPPVDTWPYTMLLVSEVLESHGSSSMASVCGSTLALMDAGVPITKPVAGIAMGLVSDDTGNFKVLTDIAGIEDEKGDMDLKIAGTRDGITAMQMDIKLGGLTQEVLTAALEQAKQARLFLLDEMAKVLAAPRPELSKYAPRIETIRIPVDKIGDLIGPKGKHINEIIEKTGVEIDIADDGVVSITSNDGEAMKKAKEWVHNMTRTIQAGERFDGRVSRIMDFGAFVELVPNVEGMVHISQFRDERVESIHDIVKVGDIIPVLVVEIDSMGRINLSHKAALPGGNANPAAGMERRPSSGPRRGGPGGGGFRNGPRPPRR